MSFDFFQVVSVSAFLAQLASFAPAFKTEQASLQDSLGRVLGRDIMAEEDLPPFHRSGMDGFAIRAADVFGTSETNPAYLSLKGDIGIDRLPDFAIRPGQCARIVTGAGLPEGADSVIMMEYTEELGDGDIEIRRSIVPGENVMYRGEDCEQGDLVLTAGTLLRAPELGLLAALGQQEVYCYTQPSIGVLSTGNEIVPAKASPQPGQIRDVNAPVIRALVQQNGARAVSFGIVPDDRKLLQHSLEQALEQCDAVLLSGGSSVGSKDISMEAIEHMEQAQVLAHGVALSPGKPTILANIKQKPLLGLPGQVTSAQVVMHVLVIPFLRHLSGCRHPFDRSWWPSRKGYLTRNVSSKPGREDYIRVRLEETESGSYAATPLLGMSGLLRTMLGAQGLVRIPANLEGLKQEEPVEVYLI